MRKLLGLIVLGLWSCGSTLGGEVVDALNVLEQANAGLKRVVLDNGMILLIKEDHSAPVAAVQIWVGSGAVHEEEFLGSGLSHFVEHMIFKGTPTRTPGDIMKQGAALHHRQVAARFGNRDLAGIVKNPPGMVPVMAGRIGQQPFPNQNL